MSLLWAILSVVLCAASMVLCVLYMMRSLYTAWLLERWSWRRTEEMLLGGSAFCIFVFIIWAVLDIA
jgi:hypothetical protein